MKISAELPILCLSLPRSTERWTRMQKRFQYYHLNVEKFPGITTPSPDLKFSSALSQTARCCAEAHFRMWQYIIENKLECCLILEDDAMFHKDWIKKLEAFDCTTEAFDAIFLNASEPSYPEETWVIATDQFLTAAYILSLEGAQKLVYMFRDCLYGADWMTVCLQRDRKCLSYFPWLVIQEGDSFISTNFTADHAKVIRSLESTNTSFKDYI